MSRSSPQRAAIAAQLRRQLALARAARLLLLATFLAAAAWAALRDGGPGPLAIVWVLAVGLGVWVLAGLHALRIVRCVRLGTVLMGLGQLDNAEIWLRRAVGQFTFSVRGKCLAGQQLASLMFTRGSYDATIDLCRELLRRRPGGTGRQALNARLLLADALLLRDRPVEAREVLGPVDGRRLSLVERMKLLPIRLRCQLAAGDAASAARELPEQVRLAELLDSAGAALVHALLAEACRRLGRDVEAAFLRRRAALYHDLEPLLERYPVLAPPAAAGDAPGAGPPGRLPGE